MMLSKRKPISVELAMDRIMGQAQSGSTEETQLEDCHNRVLAENIVATHAVPPFSKSPYDGFALRAADTKSASKENPVNFIVTELIGAGFRAQHQVKQGEAVRIMTGAEIPSGADCVVMLERCESYEDNKGQKITLRTEMEAGQNIIEKGSETIEGKTLVSKGTEINPGVQALLATFGYHKVKTAKKPVVGIYATGSELLEVDQPLEPGKIRNSNAYMVASQVRRAGGDPVYFGKLNDDFDVSFKAVSEAIDKVDVLITTGGVSVGDFDLLPDIYKKLEADVLFNKVAMRPGSVTTVAKKNGTFLFGLSGNPSACYVGFELFARTVISTLLGRPAPFLNTVEAELDEDFTKANPFTRFVRSNVFVQGGKLRSAAAGIDKSAVVTSLASTNALTVLPGGMEGFQKGEKVQVLLLESRQGAETFNFSTSVSKGRT